MNKHIFSIFFDNLHERIFGNDSVVEINDEFILHRIKNILRLQKNEEIIIFDKNLKIKVNIIEYKKKSILFKIKESENIVFAQHKIYSFTPILKQDSLEEVFFYFGMLGINEIFLVETELSHKRKLTEKDFDRLNKFILSGIEQGKKYIHPNLNKKIINLDEMINFIEKMKFNESFFWLNENGQTLNKFTSELGIISNKSFFVGPEAGLNKNEIDKLEKFKSFSIGNSILRSHDCIKFISIMLRAI